MKVFLYFLFLLLPAACADLRVGFYSSTCPQAESIIRAVVQRRFARDRSITGSLLRMHFHDCFVRGCDASILIDTTTQKPSEKTAGPNLTVRGYELIDEAKAALEAQCPSTVSCADIITVATRDSVALAGGPSYAIPTGRRDGLVSNPEEVNLPGPGSSVPQALEVFRAKGLTLTDMVTLLGAHTVGIAHCGFFQDRLSNFRGTGSPDPSMDPVLRAKLVQTCRSGSGQEPSTFLDQATPFVFDNKFYGQVLSKRGVMRIDQELSLDSSSSGIVSSLASDSVRFGQQFGEAMVKLGSVDALVGSAGEIRKNCRLFNQRN
ncbi:peroxidase [Ranunculus cassubicifolius]